MNNKKIAVYYIATGDYKVLFPDFLESLQYFFPECDKKVKLISDGLEEYSTYEKGRVKVELCPRINNYPWPVIALYKMWHIKENADESCDYACYFNANSIVNEHNPKVFNENKISASYHSFCSKKREYNFWDNININPYSSAFLLNETYEYVQSGFFFGPSDLIYKMCDDVIELLKRDTKRHIFAQWHDESYFNKWCVINSNLVEKKFILAAYKDDVDSNRFIYLRDKRNYFKRNR